jgi:hypothetical protein
MEWSRLVSVETGLGDDGEGVAVENVKDSNEDYNAGSHERFQLLANVK